MTKTRKRIFSGLTILLLSTSVAIVYLSLSSRPAPEHPFYEDNKLQVIAHRGGRGLRPENTLAAFQKAVEIGVDILEMDIHQTRDGHLVVIHDALIDRTTNGKGVVKSFTLKELQSFDAAFYFSPDEQYSNQKDKSVYSKVNNLVKTFPLRGTGVIIPTLRKVFEMFPGKRMIIEIKQKEPSITTPFCELIREFHKEKEIIMGSFHQETLYEFRKVCPDVTTSTGPMEVVSFLLLGKTHLSETLSPIATALQVPEEAEIPIAGFRPVIQVVNESFMKAAMKKNMAVQVWTVNEKDQMERLISLGVDGIMTDYPDRLIELIK